MIFFLYGEDTYRSHEKLLRLKEQFLAKHGNTIDTFSFDFSEVSTRSSDISEMFQSLENMTLFAKKKIITAKRLFSSDAGNMERIELFATEYFSALEQDHDIALIVWEEKTDKRKKLFKLLFKHAYKPEEFSCLKGKQFEEWIIKRAALYGKKIEKQAILLLVENISGTANADAELRKAANFSENEIITAEALLSVASFSPQNTVFEALDAIGDGNKKRAFVLLTDRVRKGEDPLYLLSMCAYEIRNLLRVLSCLEDGMFDPGAIARELSLHPFVAGKLIRQARVFSKDKLIRAFQLLARLDNAAKTGKIDSALALEEWVIKF